MLRGGRLCGSIQYEISGRLGPIARCHCSQCQKASGAAFATNASVVAESSAVVRGETLLIEYQSSPGKMRAFCRRCGSPLYTTHESRPRVRRVRLGTLDGDPGAGPVAHIWVVSKAQRFQITDSLDRFYEWPPASYLAPG